MPTYAYACTACGHTFDVFQSMKDAPLKLCPACGQETAQRQISAGAGLIFKGTGFYITDYRKPSAGGGGGESSGASGGSGEAPKAASAAPAKNESKTAPASGSA